MFTSRMACKVIHPIQTSLQLYHVPQLCGKRLKAFDLRIVSYCITAKDNIAETSSDPKLKVFNNNRKGEEARHYNNRWDNDNRLQYAYNRNKTIDHVKTSTKKIEELFPHPVNSLREFYIAVGRELNIKNPMSLNSKQVKMKRNTHFEHTYILSWPEEKRFSDISTNKSSAARKAALKCLSWLHSMGKFKDGKPNIYTHEEINIAIDEPVDMSIPPKFFDKIKNVVQKFDSDIKNIVKASDSLDENDIVLEDTQHGNFNPAHISVSTKLARNKALEQRLSIRPTESLDLPIFKFREQILHHLEENQVFLIKGDTGCGKTTQVPQFIIDAYTKQGKATECNVIVSQPRRISATSLAERVAYERNESVGDVVGYHVRLYKKLPVYDHGITFCTTGILLRRLQFDPDLEGVTHLILDEAHERTVDIDVLLTLLKKVLERNKTLKLIIMSATLNAETFQRYFGCAVIEVPGYLYPVKMHFLEDMQDMGIIDTCNIPNTNEELLVDSEKVVKLIEWISFNKPPGAILCFLPGWSDIVYIQNLLRYNHIRGQTIAVHSKLPHHVQREIFSTPDKDVRKIILATDIAETGITIKDVAYVIDTAIKKESRYNSKTGLHYIENQWVSQANILQRKGRAGRIQAGESYHMITKQKFQQLHFYPQPEILRVSLDRPLLDSKKYTTQKAKDFFMSMPNRPAERVIQSAVDTLTKLGAIDSEENLTPLGKRMVHFTMAPRLSKAMVYAAVFNCTDPLVTIGSMFSSEENVFSNVLSQRMNIREKKKQYHSTSDHIAMLDMVNDWQERLGNDPFEATYFCKSMGIMEGRMHMLQLMCEMNKQYLIQSRMLNPSDVEYNRSYMNKYSPCTELIRAVLFSATRYLLRKRDFTFEKGRFTKAHIGIQSDGNTKVMITQDSVNYKQNKWPSPFLTYIQSLHSQERRQTLIRETSMILPLSVFLFSREDIHYRDVDSNDESKVSIQIGDDSFVHLSCDKETLTLMSAVRNNLWDTVDYIIRQQGVSVTPSDNLVKVTRHKDEILDVITGILDELSKPLDPYPD